MLKKSEAGQIYPDIPTPVEDDKVEKLSAPEVEELKSNPGKDNQLPKIKKKNNQIELWISQLNSKRSFVSELYSSGQEKSEPKLKILFSHNVSIILFWITAIGALIGIGQGCISVMLYNRGKKWWWLEVPCNRLFTTQVRNAFLRISYFTYQNSGFV